MKPTNLDRWICRAEGLEHLTREALERLQLEKLNRMLPMLKSHGGIYEGLPDRLDRLSGLQDLPFTTPEMLARRPGQFLIRSQSQVDRVITGSTSGTTGAAKRVFYTKADTDRTVDFFAAGISEMLHGGEKCLIAFPFSGESGLGDLIARAVRKLGGIPVPGIAGGTYGALCDQIRREQPETYIGFPVLLLSLARMYPGEFPIRRALLSGDACPDGVISELEKILGTKTFPHYGSRETVFGGAVTCPAFKGMHLRENDIIAEIVDESGRVLPDGCRGELVITTVGMEAMPLLRYRTGDYTRILPEPCPCGGITKRLDRVTRKPSGRYAIEELDSLLFPVPGLVDYRASREGKLRLNLQALDRDTEAVVYRLVAERYHDSMFSVHWNPASMEDRPMYPGKRYIPDREDLI